MKKDIIDIMTDKVYKIIQNMLIIKFRPDLKYDEVKKINLEEVKALKKKYGIGGIILDIDETLRKDTNNIPKCNEEWLKFIKQEFKVHFVSNGRDDKIQKIAEEMDIGYTSLARKPLRKSFLEAAEKMGLDPENILVIGDSVIDDIYGGKRSNMKTAFVKEVNGDDER